jgi:hypothetical protein
LKKNQDAVLKLEFEPLLGLLKNELIDTYGGEVDTTT